MSHFIDVETSFLREAMRKSVWKNAIIEEY
jgi:hypothetical protein